MANEDKMLELLPAIATTFNSPATIVDCGFCDGSSAHSITSSLNSLKLSWRYFGIEADARLQPYVPPGVVLIRAAVADFDGEIDFHLSSGNDDNGGSYYGSSSIHPPGPLIATYWPKMRFNQTVKVPAFTLDTLCDQRDIHDIDFLWCDIQGGEGELVRGAKRMMPRTKWFFTEYSSSQLYAGQIVIDELKQLLDPYMVVYKDFGGDILFKNKQVL